MRKGCIIAGALLGGVGGIGTVVYANFKDEWFPLKDKISARIAEGDPSCPDSERPLSLTLTNGSDQTVTSLSYEITAKRRGYSSVLERASHDTDKIMSPGESVGYCVPLPGKAMNEWLEGDLFGGSTGNPYKDFPGELEFAVEVSDASAEPST